MEGKQWFSYKCRAECLYDIAHIIYKLYEYTEYSDIRILNTKIVDQSGSFLWKFDSDRTLEELLKMIKRIDHDNNGDLHRLYQTINYKAVYNEECIRSM
jgi:hypothetical protein